MRAVEKLARTGWFLLWLLAVSVGFVGADDCGSPADCQAPPRNIDGATGIAAGAAGAALVVRIFRGRGS